MSYQTYTTEALVCGAYDSNTADKSFLLFTRRAGMLYASARSVREERSKQRYALQIFSHVTISLVRGKSGWRIGSVESRGNLFSKASDRATRGSVVSIVKLVRQYVQGEETNPVLYDEVMHGLLFLSVLPDEAHRTNWENLIKLRILYQLGYIAPQDEVVSLITNSLSEITKAQLTSHYQSFSKLLEAAKRVSHLAHY